MWNIFGSDSVEPFDRLERGMKLDQGHKLKHTTELWFESVVNKPTHTQAATSVSALGCNWFQNNQYS